MRRNTKLIFSAIIALAIAGIAGTASAAPAPQHPAYLRALSDLRDARANLSRPNGGALERQEQDAIAEIDRAIGEIKAAAIDDGKNIEDHVPVDPHMPWGGRLHKALNLLDKAHNDVDRAEEDPAARGLKHRALDHIDRAHHHVEEAIAIVH
jgi:hypothetical protein